MRWQSSYELWSGSQGSRESNMRQFNMLRLRRLRALLHPAGMRTRGGEGALVEGWQTDRQRKARWGRGAWVRAARGHQHLGHPHLCVLVGVVGEGSFLQGSRCVKAKLFLGGSFLQGSGRAATAHASVWGHLPCAVMVVLGKEPPISSVQGALFEAPTSVAR